MLSEVTRAPFMIDFKAKTRTMRSISSIRYILLRSTRNSNPKPDSLANTVPRSGGNRDGLVAVRVKSRARVYHDARPSQGLMPRMRTLPRSFSSRSLRLGYPVPCRDLGVFGT